MQCLFIDLGHTPLIKLPTYKEVIRQTMHFIVRPGFVSIGSPPTWVFVFWVKLFRFLKNILFVLATDHFDFKFIFVVIQIL